MWRQIFCKIWQNWLGNYFRNFLNFFIMPTTKRRVSVTLPGELEGTLKFFRKKNQLSFSATILVFLKQGLEMAEDEYFSSLADELHAKTTRFSKHTTFWKNALTR